MTFRVTRSCWSISVALLVSGCVTSTPPTVSQQSTEVMFDDFSYATAGDLARNGWTIRTKTGHPGLLGATWAVDGLTLHDDPARQGNRVARMTAATDGTGQNTRQVQLCHARKYYEGTYAARVRFTDAPTVGPDGDQVVQTFYVISPLKAPLHPDYSEMDFEYLPNGGWGKNTNTLFATSWETFQFEPWTQVNTNTNVEGSQAGWRTLVLQVARDTIRYYVDGRPLGTHGAEVYPEVPMSMNFNLWFIRDGVAASREPRRYEQDIDWVFHAKNAVLSPADVGARISAFRAAGRTFQDTIRPAIPALESPCDI